MKQADSIDLNLSNVDSNITDPDLPLGCFDIQCVYGQGAWDEYDTGVPLFKCGKCKDIVCDKCFNDAAHRGHQKYLKPYTDG